MFLKVKKAQKVIFCHGIFKKWYKIVLPKADAKEIMLNLFYSQLNQNFDLAIAKTFKFKTVRYAEIKYSIGLRRRLDQLNFLSICLFKPIFKLSNFTGIAKNGNCQ